MNDQALILVTRMVTAKDIPLIAKYNPFIISKEPITDRDVIRAFNKDGALRGISGVESIEDLSVTIGKELVKINGAISINNMISVLSGERGYTTVSDKEDEEDIVEEEADSSNDLAEKIKNLEAAVKDLADELKKRPRQVIVQDGSTKAGGECNPGILSNLEIGWLANIGQG